MLGLFSKLRPLLFGMIAAQALSVCAQAPRSPFPGFSAKPASTGFPGVEAKATDTVLPGDTPRPMGPAPLTAPPAVIALTHLDPAQMSDADNAVVESLRAELAQAAAAATFDISNPAWHYQQIVCPTFPGYVVLAFTRGPQGEGSSRFVAILAREGNARVKLVSAYGHGLLPFQASFNRPGTFQIFNRMLRQQRGQSPLGDAPNWLAIGICYAEMSGYAVQVLSTIPNPGPTLDLLRLDANRPQLFIDPDQSASIRFSDVSQPTLTVQWNLHFNRMGEITSVSRESTRQPVSIARRP